MPKAFRIFRLSKERVSNNDMSEILQIVNDPRSFFASPLFDLKGLETGDRSKADWLIDIVPNSTMRANFGPSFEGLSVTMKKIKTQFAGTESAEYVEPCETYFNGNNWTSVPSVSGHTKKS